MFFTDVRVPKENVVGGINNGWAVAMGLLGFERGEAAAGGKEGVRNPSALEL